MNRFNLGALTLCILGIVGCVVGALIDPTAFLRAWLPTYLFWLGVPLAGVTLVLVHDLSGGDWMQTARPVLTAAISTMPIATVAGIPAIIGVHSLYVWTDPATSLGNVFYLNTVGFFVRYVIYVVLWNLLAAFALWGPREGKLPIPPGHSWISGIGLVVLALSAGFASIDWILSLEPTFWSAIFPYIQSACWFNTGLAAVLLIIAVLPWPEAASRDHMRDLSKILLATTIFWAYVEFMQFLIIWEENLRAEIPWYLKRFDSGWSPAIYVSAGLGFVIPFFVFLWGPSKRNRAVVAAVCAVILISRLANTWLLVMPEFKNGTPLWLNAAAVLALGGLMLLPIGWHSRSASEPMWTSDHG